MKTFIACAVLGALALTPIIATAGLKSSATVSITSTKFSGNLADVRNSADGVQYIGCQIGSEYSYCSARNAAGSSVMCSSSNPGVMAAIAAITPNSHLEVYFSAGSCTTVWVRTMSNWATPLGASTMVGVP